MKRRSMITLVEDGETKNMSEDAIKLEILTRIVSCVQALRSSNRLTLNIQGGTLMKVRREVSDTWLRKFPESHCDHQVKKPLFAKLVPNDSVWVTLASEAIYSL